MSDEETENNFKQAVLEYLKPLQNSFNYNNLVNNHLDISRFYPWIDDINHYKMIKGSSILSSGCGSGGDMYAFLDYGAKIAHGIEVDKDLADLAEARFHNTPYTDKVIIDVYPGLELPYENEQFDIIYSSHVLEHTIDPKLYLTELFRVLRTDGIIYLELPNRYYPIEQHTELRWIHYLPMKIRNTVIDLIVNGIGPLTSKELKYKYQTLRNYYFPFPHKIIDIINENKQFYNLSIIRNDFHSYDGDYISYKKDMILDLFLKYKWFTTFRLIIKKDE